jgi:hypothetical protein
MSDTQLQVMTEVEPLSIKQITGQVQLIQQVMREVMKEGEHFGKIPGCGDKPALLKAGAEKLGMTFRLAPTFDVRQTDHANQHREYQVTCTLNGRHQGVGSCSTMEGKYRFRTGPKKSTGKPMPKEYWTLRASNPAKAQELLGGKGFVTAKEDGQWMICEQGEKVEHDNPADHYNTVLKMAKKRAHVDAILTATAASDIFTQDLEEIVENDAVASGKPPKMAQETPDLPNHQTIPPQAEKPRQEPSGERQPAKSSEVLPLKEATEATRDWFLGQIVAATLSAEAKAYFLSINQLLPTEEITDLPLRFVPTTKEAAREVIGKIQDFAFPNGRQSGDDEPWRAFPVPFGKHAGVPMGDLDKKVLWGFWVNFEVEEEYNGRPKKADIVARDRAFRDALDQAGEHCEFKESNQ